MTNTQFLFVKNVLVSPVLLARRFLCIITPGWELIAALHFEDTVPVSPFVILLKIGPSSHCSSFKVKTGIVLWPSLILWFVVDVTIMCPMCFSLNLFHICWLPRLCLKSLVGSGTLTTIPPANVCPPRFRSPLAIHCLFVFIYILVLLWLTIFKLGGWGWVSPAANYICLVNDSYWCFSSRISTCLFLIIEFSIFSLKFLSLSIPAISLSASDNSCIWIPMHLFPLSLVSIFIHMLFSLMPGYFHVNFGHFLVNVTEQNMRSGIMVPSPREDLLTDYGLPQPPVKRLTRFKRVSSPRKSRSVSTTPLIPLG